MVQAILHIEQMDEGQLARAAGQILYDLAIQDPTITVASPEILGRTLKTTLMNDEGKLFKSWYPLLRLYLKHSLVAKDPRLVAIAMSRMVTVQLYIAGKLTDADPTNSARA